MRQFALASVLLLASAQLGFAATTFDVTVGGTALTFVPPSVIAQVGDTIRFTFKQKNHTVTQSTLQNPCVPLANGFNSGFVPVAANKTTDFPTAELTLKNLNPIWAYCAQANHCSSSGMVFAVNPGSQFAAFQSAATQAPSSTLPPSVTSTSAPVPTSSGLSSGADHRVIVGGTGVLAFSPTNITAQVGDTVTFEFHQKNHTVTASSFNSPCVELSASGPAGFDSGFKPVGDGVTDFPTYTVRVNDTKPIWAYCRQANHCSSGMVFAVNTDESSAKTFAAFQALAKGSGSSTSGSSGYPSSATGRPSSSMAVVLGLFAAAFLV